MGKTKEAVYKGIADRIRSRFGDMSDDWIIAEQDRRLAKAHRDRNDAIELMREAMEAADEARTGVRLVGDLSQLRHSLSILQGHARLMLREIDVLERRKVNGTASQ